jgi:hypothetical protein
LSYAHWSNASIFIFYKIDAQYTVRQVSRLSRTWIIQSTAHQVHIKAHSVQSRPAHIEYRSVNRSRTNIKGHQVHISLRMSLVSSYREKYFVSLLRITRILYSILSHVKPPYIMCNTVNKYAFLVLQHSVQWLKIKSTTASSSSSTPS